MILYLLPFKTGTEFKFGITKTDRVYGLDKLYGIDLARAKVVRAKSSKTIRSIEHQIKNEYFDVRSTNYEGSDGWTEILPIEYWDEVLSDILLKQQKERLGIQIQDGIPIKEKIIKPLTVTDLETILVEYIDYVENLTPEGVFYLNHRYGELLIEAIRSGKTELELSEKDYPCIHDFAERMRYFFTSPYLVKRIKKGRSTRTLNEKLNFKTLLTFTFDFESVKFFFSKCLIEDVMNGHLEHLMQCTRPAYIENIFYHEMVQTRSEAIAWLKYLTTSDEEFERLCRLREYLPDIPPSQSYNVTRKPIDLRKDIANENDWKLLWYESKQNEKCSFEEFLVRGGYSREGDQWIKFY